MESINNSIIKSLDGRNKNLLPFIPYLLQDLWEIGSSPEVINQLLKKHKIMSPNSRVLDLGCGKGAISVNLAIEFSCQVYGIDAMPEFIEEANYWADKFHQTHLCNFEVGDIRDRLSELREFDLIILGSIGAVIGDIETTLKSIWPVLTKRGYLILDDGYIPDNSDFKNKNYLYKSEAERQIQKSGFSFVEACIMDDNYIAESDTDIYQRIEKRAQELIVKYPRDKQLFEDYLENQRIENDILENKVECVTWLLRKSD